MSHPVNPLSAPYFAQVQTVCAHFLAALPKQAHLLNANCGSGEDLAHLRQLGHVVTACEPRLVQAKLASQQTGQAVRVCHIEQIHSVLPYDGIWISGQFGHHVSTLTTQLQRLASLLKPGALLGIRLPQDALTHTRVLVQMAIQQAGLPLRDLPFSADGQQAATLCLQRILQPMP
ncbi:class I SAM-dependent methyltransferase [Aeromonas enteropelogenes]|uniref:class I SAM-dependent methyltransferase n=1 Tax=Aeromonas enteropelogenes TaxID=29489 RepID=UPI003989933C